MKRKKGNDKLPPRVYKDRSRFYYRPYLGREAGRPKYGKPIRLCGLDSSTAEVWHAYENLLSKDNNTLDWLLGVYLKSDQYRERAGKTQAEYARYADIIANFKLTSGRRFGEAPLAKINKRVIRGYLDAYPAKVAANRHIQFLSAVFSWGEERYPVVTTNPCKGVRKNSEASRTRYIEDWEYYVTYCCAVSMRNPMMALAMEISYLCAARRYEVFSLTSKNVRKEGIWLQRGKGSEDEITRWSDRLREAVEGCRQINISAPTPINKPRYLIKRKDGSKYTKNALDSAWQRVIKKAMTEGAELPTELLEEAKRDGARLTGNRVMIDGDFTFHDIKAKGYSDRKDHNAGHKSERMHSVYMRKPQLRDATQ